MGRLLPRSYIAHPEHGPLPAFLVVLTLVTGIVDAVSILALGRVFVANMTGNVVFIGFALAGTPGFSLIASLSALAGFLVGARVGGAAGVRYLTHRGVLLRDTVAAQLVLFVIALVVVLVVGTTLSAAAAAGVAALMALAMGLQNATARRLAVPDLTTTVLTMTLTGIVADTHHENSGTLVRRLLAVVAMLIGAAAGAVIVMRAGVVPALIVVVVLVAGVTVAAALAARARAPWQEHSGRS